MEKISNFLLVCLVEEGKSERLENKYDVHFLVPKKNFEERNDNLLFYPYYIINEIYSPKYVLVPLSLGLLSFWSLMLFKCQFTLSTSRAHLMCPFHPYLLKVFH